MKAWTDWQVIGTLPGSGAPALACNKDGRLEAFAFDTQGAMWHCWETRPGGAWNTTWESFNPHRHSVNPPQYGPVAAANADGRLEVFVCEDGRVRHKWQKRPNTGKPWDWSVFDEELLADAVQIYSARFHTPPVDRTSWPGFSFTLDSFSLQSGWSDWEDFETIAATGAPIASCGADGRLDLFVPTAAGLLYKWQLDTVFGDEYARRINWSQGWAVTSLSGDVGRCFVLQCPNHSREVLGAWDGYRLTQMTQLGTDPNYVWDTGMLRWPIVCDQKYAWLCAIVPSGVGTLDVFLGQSTKRFGPFDVYHRSLQPGSGGSWTCDHAQPLDKVANVSGNVIVERNANGCFELFATAPGRFNTTALIHMRQATPNGQWTSDSSLVESGTHTGSLAFSATRTQDGRLAAIARFGSDQIKLCTQLPWDREV